jgi:hypothetical protein
MVAFQFYANGRLLDDCFARIGDPEITLIERLRHPKRLVKILAGRLAWVANYPVHYRDAGDDWYESIDPYRHLPAKAGLELPFVQAQMPLGILYYDIAQP